MSRSRRVLAVLALSSCNRTLRLISLQRFVIYLTVIAGFVGPTFWNISVGPIHIFLYRLLIPLVWLLFIGNISHGKMVISRVKGVKIYLIFLVLWLFYAIASLAWALDKVGAIRNIVFLLLGISIIFFTVYFLSDKKGLLGLYRTWLLVLIGLIPIALWEVFTGNHLNVSGLYGYQPKKLADIYVRFMPSTTFHNPNDFATVLALGIPFVFTWFRYTKKVFSRITAAGILLTIFYLLLLTYSRANYIAVLLEFVFLFAILLKVKSRVKVLIALLFLGLLLIGAKPEIFGKFVDLFVGQISSIVSPYDLYAGSTYVRINLIKNALLFLWQTFGFGVGAGNAEYWMGHFGTYSTQGILNPHNWWVEILVNYGIFVFVGYILFYAGITYHLFRTYKRLVDRADKMICESLLLALVGFSFASISSSSIMELKPQWFLLSFALAFLNYRRIKQRRVA